MMPVRRTIMRWTMTLAVLLELLCVDGCSGQRDRRPWMICYRIYEQCDWVVGAMTQDQCEAFIAAKPSAAIDAILECVRDHYCEKFGPVCLKLPTSRHPRW